MHHRTGTDRRMPTTHLQLHQETARRRVGLALAGMVFGLGACISDGASDRLQAPVQAFSTNAFRVTRPTLVSHAEGLHVLGAVCRRWQDVSQRQTIRIERLSPAGQLVDATSKNLGRLDDHPIHCVFYEAPTAWRLETGQSIRVCLEPEPSSGSAESVCRPAQ